MPDTALAFSVGDFWVSTIKLGNRLKFQDHMREAGDVCFADAFKDGSGVVEFLRYEDMKYAIKKLDDSRFRSHEVCKTGAQKATISIILVFFREKWRI